MPISLITPASIGGAPAFSAYQSVAQTPSANAENKIQFQTEEFDTNSNYDTSTYRFTPTVAGYYQFNLSVQCSNSISLVTIYKNGTYAKTGNWIAAQNKAIVSALIYANGTTDYFEGYSYITSTTATTAGSSATYFQASMVRAA